MGSWTAGMVWALSCLMTQRDSLSPQDSHHPFPYEVLKQSYLNEKENKSTQNFTPVILCNRKLFFFFLETQELHNAPGRAECYVTHIYA